MPTAPLLQRFVDDELGRSAGIVERTLAGSLQLLRDPQAGSLAAAIELAQVLQRQSAVFQSTFIRALAGLVGDALDALHDGATALTAGPAAPGGLELMDESRVEVDIEISRAHQLISSTAEWELRELQTFTSTLVGQTHVSTESNPLSPLVYATALWQAACAVARSHSQQALLLRVSAGVLAGLLKNAWAAACTRLESQGVEPGVYRTVVLAPGAAAERDVDFDVTRPGALGDLLSRMPDSADRAPQTPFASAAAGAELMSRLFEAILADTELQPAFRTVLARLQVSALRVALLDSAALESHAHPVWQLVERIGSASAAYTQPADPRLNALLLFCQALAEDMARAASPDAQTYRHGLARVDAFLAEQLHQQLNEAQPAVLALQRAERRELLEAYLTQRLTDQMARVRTSPALRRFVTGSWATVLAEATLRFGDQAEATRAYQKTVDDLLWSLQLPDHPQSRQRLLALLPGLLLRLREGMALIALPAAAQQAVLDELMTVHTEALRPSTRGAAAGALTPEQIVQRLRDERLPDAPVSGAVPFGDSVIDLASMDTVPAEILWTGSQSEADAGANRIEGLRPGACLRLLLHGRWTRVQLLWRSERSHFFLFAGEIAAHTHSVTRRALERLNAEGLVQTLEARPLVQRAVDGLLREIRLPT